MGIDIPDASPSLAPWVPTNSSEENTERPDPRPIPDDAILLQPETLEIPDQNALSWALDSNNISHRFYQPNPKLAGYHWHKQLPTVTRVETTLWYSGKPLDLQDLRDSQEEVPDQRPDAIIITLHIQDPQRQEQLQIPTDFVLWNEDTEHYVDDLSPIVAKGGGATLEDMLRLLTDAYFHPRDSVDDDSWETQEQYHTDTCTKILMTLLISQEDAVKRTIETLVSRYVFHQIPLGTTATITLTRNKPIEVNLEPHQDTQQHPTSESQP